MNSSNRSPRLAKFLSATGLCAIALVSGNQAWAACTLSGTAVVCDASAPNPSGAAGGVDITILAGATVQQLDPFAGASPDYNSVTVASSGRLDAQMNSTINSPIPGGVGLETQLNSTANLSGQLISSGANGVGVKMGSGSTLNVGLTGLVVASGSSSNTIQVTGTGTTIQIDGIVRNDASFGSPTINLTSTDLFGTTINGTSAITIGAQGQVLSAGAASPAVVLTSGSSLTVAGRVRSFNSANTIDYRGTTGGDATVVIAAGGTVQSYNGPAIISSNGNLDLTIAGTVYATGTSTAVQLGSGNDRVTLVTGSSITTDAAPAGALIDAGAGTNTLILAGTGAGQVGPTANFDTATIASGTWTLTAPLAPANGTTVAVGATGIGTANLWSSTINDLGTVVFNQSTAGTFAGTLTGSGQLVKSGTGSLTLGSQGGFTGATSITAGQLVLTGAMPSTITVGSGGTLSGNGRSAGVVVQSGGTISPGTASGSGVGTLNVAGNFVQAAGSTYSAQIVGSTADKLAITGSATLATGSTLSLGLQNASLGRYTVLTADGGITGQYTLTQSDLATIAYRVSYTANSVVVDLGRSNQQLLALAQGSNQVAMVTALTGLPTTNPLYAALALTPDDATVGTAYPQLTGDIHGALRTAIMRSAELVAGAALGRADQPQGGLQVWGQMLGSTGRDSAIGGAVDVSRKSFGVVMGLEGTTGAATLGLAGGYIRATLDGGNSTARVNTPQVLGYARGVVGGLSWRAGIGYAWGSNDVTRQVAFTGFSDTNRSHYNSHAFHGFGEIGAPLPLGGGVLTPLVAGRFYRLWTNAFAESGGAAALQGQSRARWSEMSEVGVRFATPVSDHFSAQGRLTWQHRFGSSEAITQLRFAAGGQDFTTRGAELSRDAAALDLGVSWTDMNRVRLDLGYNGTVGSTGHDNVGRFTISVAL
jgi:uncharacterized protein with beta-barrel porin domain